jgi:hypothetical protein
MSGKADYLESMTAKTPKGINNFITDLIDEMPDEKFIDLVIDTKEPASYYVSDKKVETSNQQIVSSAELQEDVKSLGLKIIRYGFANYIHTSEDGKKITFNVATLIDRQSNPSICFTRISISPTPEWMAD